MGQLQPMKMELNLESFGIAILSSVSTITIASIIIYFFRSWLVMKLRWSMKHKYDKEMLKVDTQKEIRLKAEVVADLFAEWIRTNDEINRYQLNKLSFQAFLWLPNNLAEDLSHCLSHTQNAKDIRVLLTDIRKHLQGHDDGFKSEKIIVFIEDD